MLLKKCLKDVITYILPLKYKYNIFVVSMNVIIGKYDKPSTFLQYGGSGTI